jgi:hypothetical protein
MANQPEVSVFELGIYQFETTDVVEGGLGGVDNKPLLQLANRTKWLYDQRALKGDLKEIDVLTSYITANFDATGLGKNERLGWAICNGDNGTKNRNGLVSIGYGTSYPTLGAGGGAETHTLTIPEIPPHNHNVYGEDNDAVPSAPNGEVAQIYNFAGSSRITSSTGGGQPHNNMQPYIVTLIIMKL